MILLAGKTDATPRPAGRLGPLQPLWATRPDADTTTMLSGPRHLRRICAIVTWNESCQPMPGRVQWRGGARGVISHVFARGRAPASPACGPSRANCSRTGWLARAGPGPGPEPEPEPEPEPSHGPAYSTYICTYIRSPNGLSTTCCAVLQPVAIKQQVGLCSSPTPSRQTRPTPPFCRQDS